ncbi:MAG: hypothetical protein KDN22_31310, partial [Verrucomicrobiae bacterium]|nr:hypothetical protein [Verrucomicrobiae bacterium]
MADSKVALCQESTVRIVDPSSDWSYYDRGAPPADWVRFDFDDGAWTKGAAPLGYGDPVATGLDFGGNPNDKIPAYYFRKSFHMDADPSDFSHFLINLRRDDGAVVFLNGVEVGRSNMPEGAVNHTTLAITQLSEPTEFAFIPIEIPVERMVLGVNVIAVEVHQGSLSSSDLAFDLSLSGILKGENPVATSRTGDIQYFLMKDSRRVLRFDLANAVWLSPFSVEEAVPVRIAADAAGVFVVG